MKLLIGSFGRILAYFLFYGPAFVRKALAYFLAFLWFDVLRLRRQVIDENMKIAFPSWTAAKRRRMGRKNLRHLGLNFVEYSFMPWLSRRNYERYFVFENAPLFEEALSRGKGVLLLTLHLGNGDLACAGLSLRGYPVVMVSKFFKIKWLNDLWFGMRERLGTRFVAPRDSSFALLKSLKQGRAVIIPLDQFTGPPIGVRTTFFGHETGTAAGLAVMAERSGAPVISVYTYRREDGRHVVRFAHEMPVRLAPDETVEAITQRFNDELQRFVVQHPDQWMWIHRRWKKFKH